MNKQKLLKMYYYKNYGVSEYWIVDPMTQTVLVYFFEENSFTVRQYSFQDKINVILYDDLWIDFTEIGSLR